MPGLPQRGTLTDRASVRCPEMVEKELTPSLVQVDQVFEGQVHIMGLVGKDVLHEFHVRAL